MGLLQAQLNALELEALTTEGNERQERITIR
jgi:hypothetical protein